jgi:hypothetical protein
MSIQQQLAFNTTVTANNYALTPSVEVRNSSKRTDNTTLVNESELIKSAPNGPLLVGFDGSIQHA